mmetsp:Transcript_35008/g.108915  ORF Transcript_35008/g.108915 Transcript_35008/m.108915 type:complete len:291 (-) Transcript_35008:10-882(-)
MSPRHSVAFAVRFPTVPSPPFRACLICLLSISLSIWSVALATSPSLCSRPFFSRACQRFSLSRVSRNSSLLSRFCHQLSIVRVHPLESLRRWSQPAWAVCAQLVAFRTTFSQSPRNVSAHEREAREALFPARLIFLSILCAHSSVVFSATLLKSPSRVLAHWCAASAATLFQSRLMVPTACWDVASGCSCRSSEAPMVASGLLALPLLRPPEPRVASRATPAKAKAAAARARLLPGRSGARGGPRSTRLSGSPSSGASSGSLLSSARPGSGPANAMAVSPQPQRTSMQLN